MPMLGDMLAAAGSSAGTFQAWLAGADPELADRVAAAAVRTGLGPAAYARMAVADFSRLASEEDWATLISSMRDDQDPGTVCLLAMVHWRLTVRGCSDHSFIHHQHHEGADDERHRARPAE